MTEVYLALFYKSVTWLLTFYFAITLILRFVNTGEYK